MSEINADKKRTIRGERDDEGLWKYRTNLTPTDSAGDIGLLVDTRRVIPVVLLPGILATRLRNTKQDEIVWDPPDTLGEAIVALFRYLFKSTQQRLEELDPDNTVVDYGLAQDTEEEDHDEHNKPNYEDRGWGALYHSSYFAFMADLEKKLNDSPGPQLPEGFRVDPGEYGGHGADPLTDEEYKTATCEYQYDVWGCGYNWLQDNDISADKAWEYIENTVLAHYSENRLNENKKILIVTHSMGSIVTRAVCKNAARRAQILGVVHLAQPAAGAPATYKYMRGGYEGIEQVLLGRNAADVSGMLGRVQSGLQLLPFPHYGGGQPWLICPAETGKESYEIQLPGGGDPYTDIYTSNKWYGLLPDQNLKYLLYGREATPEAFVGIRDEFSMIIDEVQKFHRSLSNFYHPNTYAVWGAEKGTAWRQFHWSSHHESRPYMYGHPDISAPHYSPDLNDDGNGSITHGSYTYHLKKDKCPGDSTVPDVSAQDQKDHSKAYFVHGDKSGSKNQSGGWVHMACCNDTRVRWAAVYSIIKLVSAAKERNEV